MNKRTSGEFYQNKCENGNFLEIISSAKMPVQKTLSTGFDAQLEK